MLGIIHSYGDKYYIEEVHTVGWLVIFIILNLLIFADLLSQACSADNGADLNEADYDNYDAEGQSGILHLVIHGFSTASLVRACTGSAFFAAA
ncbi:hypothetical protein HHC11_11150 [Neisseria meningitidis]|nr:hypothetical protein [Neisseria meningitidis]